MLEGLRFLAVSVLVMASIVLIAETLIERATSRRFGPRKDQP